MLLPPSLAPPLAGTFRGGPSYDGDTHKDTLERTNSGLVPLSGTPFAHSYTAHGEEGAERGGDENEKRPGAGQSMEEKVGQVWREALGLPFHVPLHSNDNFFASGGDSLTALSVIKRLLQWSQSQSRSESAPFQWPEDGMVQVRSRPVITVSLQ